MCLPFSDPAWDTCSPPNGWGCRCDVIQVIPGTHPRSQSEEAVDLMEEMTPGKQEIFRFNPGKEQKLIPPRHPYYGKKGYDHCTTKQGKLAANLDKNEECKVLRNIKRKVVDRSYLDRLPKVYRIAMEIVDELCGKDPTRRQTEPVPFATIPDYVISYLKKEHNIDLKAKGQSTQLHINEEQVKHALRGAKQDRGQGLSPEEFLLIKKAVHSRFGFDEHKGRHTLVLALKLNNEEWAKWCFQLGYGIGKYGKSNRLVTSRIINERNLPKEIK